MRIFIIFSLIFTIACAANIPTSPKTENEIKISTQKISEKLQTILKGMEVELPPVMVQKMKNMLGNHPENTIEEAIRDGSITALLNEYADKIFENIRSLLVELNLDPLTLPDEKLSVLVGSLALSEGELRELSTMGRGGDVVVQYSTTTKKLAISVPIKFDDILLHYGYKVSVLLISVHGGVDGEVKNCGADITLGMEFFNYHAFVEDLDIYAGKVHIKFIGNVLIDWLLDAVTDVLTLFFKNLVVTIIDHIIQYPAQAIVDIINRIVDAIFHASTTTIGTTAAEVIFNAI